MQAHPYRKAHASSEARAASGDPDVGIIYALAIVLGGVRLAVAFAVGEDFGAEAVIAAILVLAGVLGALWDR